MLTLILIMPVQHTISLAIRNKADIDVKDHKKSDSLKDVEKNKLLAEMFSHDAEIKVLENLLTELEQDIYTDDKSVESVTNPPKVKENSEEIRENENEIGESTEEIPTATEYFEKDLADDIFDIIEEDLVDIVEEYKTNNSLIVIVVVIGCSVSISNGIFILILY